MTDPQNPAPNTPPSDGGVPPVTPPAYDAAPPAPPAYGAPAEQPPYTQSSQPYASAPPAYGAPATATVPGKTMGIVAFILSFFVQVIALILGIIALVQSRKAGAKNGFALAAIIISSVLIVLGIIFLIIFLAVILPLIGEGTQQLLDFCNVNGPGVFEVDGIPIDCTEVLGG